MSAVSGRDDPLRPHGLQPGKRFRKAGASARLTREQSRRQNDVLQSAWRHFGVTGPMIAFLNAHNDQLEGCQPLHLAVQSDEGLVRVERLLGEMAWKA
ncbi:MAG TPA: hypothetical protein VFZ35_02790 [Sphingomicrobium sp.]